MRACLSSITSTASGVEDTIYVTADKIRISAQGER
jgi:hypothetical protein